MDQIAPPKYPTFQDKYGQLAPTDQTYEQSKAPADGPPAQSMNPWAMMQGQPQEPMAPPEVQLAPKPWEYTGK